MFWTVRLDNAGTWRDDTAGARVFYGIVQQRKGEITEVTAKNGKSSVVFGYRMEA